MSARRFFLEGTHANGESVPLTGTDAHKITRVLRLKSGDRIEVVDSDSTVFEGTLAVEGDWVGVILQGGASARQSGARIDLAQGIPKGQKMDFVVEKLTELGVSTIYPFESERTVARDIGGAKVDRWRRLAKSAAQQSGRESIPAVADPIGFDRLLEFFKDYDAVLFLWEVARPVPLRDELPRSLAAASRILVVVGPEGGFSHDEAERAATAGARHISLGSRILRTETAALALVAILAFLVW